MPRDSFSEKAKQQIEAEQKKREFEREKKFKERRMELVGSAVRAYQAQKMGEAVANYQAFIKTVEEWKGAPKGGLSPRMFDRSKELSELLMISGVYWDLVRLYDRTKSADRKKDFLHFLEKYLLFSKGMPYEAVCAESVRKYLAHDKPKHTKEFKAAYRLLAPNAAKCFVATSLIDVISEDTSPTLRRYRDDVLKKHPSGRAFVKWYYEKGPVLADRVDRFPRPVRRLLGRSLDVLARMINGGWFQSGSAGR